MLVIINDNPEVLKHFSEFTTVCARIENLILDNHPIIHNKPVYFVSAANSLLFLDGGSDSAYIRMFNGIQKIAQHKMRNYEGMPVSLVGKKYLPIGASMIHKISNEYSLIFAPTMLYPQHVKETQNAYHAMKAILKIWPGDGVLLVPVLCGGYGKMDYETINKQIKKALDEHDGTYINGDFYIPPIVGEITKSQPKFYENSEFFTVNPNDVINH